MIFRVLKIPPSTKNFHITLRYFVNASSPLIDFYDRFKNNRKVFHQHKINNQSEILFGLHPVMLALKARKREVYQIFIKRSIWDNDRDHLRQRNSNMASLLDLVASMNYPKRLVDQRFLSDLCNDRPHQGVALECSPTKVPVLCDQLTETFISNMKSDPSKIRMTLFFDEIKDVMNFGNILRSAAFFSVDSIFMPMMASGSPMPVISKISSGAMEVLDFYRVNNKMKTLKEFHDRGFLIIGTSGQNIENSILLSDLHKSKYLSDNKPVMIVFGSEDLGVTPEMLNICHEIVRIPGDINSKLDLQISSLNVSVAAGIVLHAVHSILLKH